MGAGTSVAAWAAKGQESGGEAKKFLDAATEFEILRVTEGRQPQTREVDRRQRPHVFGDGETDRCEHGEGDEHPHRDAPGAFQYPSPSRSMSVSLRSTYCGRSET